VPPALTETCDGLAGFIDGTVPTPPLGEVIGALQVGQTPPVPGLLLPVVQSSAAPVPAPDAPAVPPAGAPPAPGPAAPPAPEPTTNTQAPLLPRLPGGL
jgi:hypothetical protein